MKKTCCYLDAASTHGGCIRYIYIYIFTYTYADTYRCAHTRRKLEFT